MMYEFDSEIKILEGKIKWKVVYFPYSVGELFNTNGKVAVQISVDGYEFEHTLLPSKNGHYLVYNEHIRRAVHKQLGDTLHIILKKCENNRNIILPAYIAAQLEDHYILNQFLNQPDYIKREQINYIELAKKEETKNNRIQTLIKKLKVNTDKQPVVLMVTGPCGSGKTTITNLIVQNHNFIRISGDDIKNEFFPEIENITDDPLALEKVYAEIFLRAKKHFENGERVIVDYVVLGPMRIEEYKSTFLEHFKIRVLLSRKEIIIKRDQSRECWTSGEECIVALYDSFDQLKDYVGAENFIDNSEETPEETYIKHFASWV